MNAFPGFVNAVRNLSTACKEAQRKRECESGQDRSHFNEHSLLQNAVDVDYSTTTATQIENIVVETSRSVLEHMRIIIASFGGSTSVFVKKFNTLEDIASALFSILPLTYKNNCDLRHMFRQKSNTTIITGDVSKLPVDTHQDTDDVPQPDEDELFLKAVATMTKAAPTTEEDMDKVLEFYFTQRENEPKDNANMDYEIAKTFENSIGRLYIDAGNPEKLATSCVQVLSACVRHRDEIGRPDRAARIKSLIERWVGDTQTIEGSTGSDDLKRDHIIERDDGHYVVTALFKLSYNKWRWIDSIAWTERHSCIVHARKIDTLGGTIIQMAKTRPILLKGVNMENIKRSYLGQIKT